MAMAKFVLVLAIAVLAAVFVTVVSNPVVIVPADTGSVQTEGQYHLDRAGGYGQGSLTSFQCAPQCSRRCSRSDHHKKACLFFCNKCCRACLCVPPGFYGNKGVCPCYNNWKTQSGGPKCP